MLPTLKKALPLQKKKTVQGNVPVVAGGQQPAYYHNTYNRNGNVITVSASGAYSGFINYWSEKIFASDCTTLKSKNEETLLTKLLYYLLKNRQDYFYSLQKGQAQPHVYTKDFQNMEVPFLSMEEQRKLMESINLKEKEINYLKDFLSTISTEKDAVLKRYL